MATLVRVAHGNQVTATVRQNTHDYAKYSMTLTKGQIVRLPAPVSGIAFRILNARSQMLANPKGFPLILEVPAAGTYYLVI